MRTINFIFLGLCLFPLLTLSDDTDQLSETELKTLSLLSSNSQEKISPTDLDKLFSEINYVYKNSIISPKAITINRDASKVEALYGTWIVSYNIGSSIYTDKLVIDSIYTADNGEIFARGLQYSNQIGQGDLMLCKYDPTVFLIIDSYYSCVAGSAIIETYSFKFSNNTISSGFYGIGFDSSGAANSALLRNKPITGYRIASSVPQPVIQVPSAYQSTYNLIQWNKRGSDNDYCLDILSDNYERYVGLTPIQCGSNMANFSPTDYVKKMNISLPNGFAFRWKIWSRQLDGNGNQIGVPNYGGEGYEGRVVVGQ